MSSRLTEALRWSLPGRGARARSLLGSASAVALLAAASSVAADVQPVSPKSAEIDALRDQVQLLLRRIEQLERQQKTEVQQIRARQREEIERIKARQDEQLEAIERQGEALAKAREDEAIAPANVVTAGDEPGSFRIPGTNTTVKIGGYVKGDFIFNVDEDLGDTLAASAITVTGAGGPDGSFRLHARQTRFNIKTETPTDFGAFRTVIEGDFFGGAGNQLVSNSEHFRLRHAYGQLGPVRIGQTWSNFQNWHYAPTVDFAGPAGQIFIRQAQVRYSGTINDNASWAVALENPEGRLRFADGGGGNTAPEPFSAASDDVAPDITGRFEWNNGDGGTSATVAGVLRFFDFSGVSAVTGDDSATGFGITGGVTQKFGNTKVMLQGTWGDGIGRYLYYGFLDGGAHVDANGNVETTEMWGGSIGLSHQISKQLSVNALFGITSIDLPANLYPSSNDELRTLHANVMYSPYDRLTYGLEFQWADRETQAGLDGDAKRIQFGAQYRF